MTRTVLASLALVLGVTLTGCASDTDSAGQKGYVSGDGSIITVAEGKRSDPIELSGEDLSGQPVDLADLRGKPVVINVWGSWCPPCRKEMPGLVDAAGELADTATFLGINVRDSSVDQALGFNRTYQVPWTSIHSPDGKALVPFIGQGIITPRTIPATIVLDARGRVAAAVVGEVTSPSTLVGLVEDAAKDS